MTLRALDMDTALEYLAAKPGFEVEAADGRLWVLRPGQEKSGKHVTRIGAGPRNATVRALDAETLESYLAYRP
jgi:NADPH-dependent glutamate synthase beta subunit-like oxidoreductase